MRTVGRLLLTYVVAALAMAGGILVVATPARALITAGRASQVSVDKVNLSQLSQRSVVYDRAGGVLAVLHAEENRSPSTLAEVPEHVVNAIIDVEDESYWTHGGINVRAILRAASENVQSGTVRQGGSTITQQLVKNSLLTPERDLNRKLREAVLAVRLEGQMSKRQILERYLNTVYFGNGAYGVKAAAETYFGIAVSELSVAQAAFLAGMIRNPVGYDPFRNYEASRARRDFALDRMVTSGHLSEEEADDLKRSALPSAKVEPIPVREEYFVEEVKQRLLKDPRLGETVQERYNAVFRGGLRIETTFDPRMQTAADEEVRAKLPDTKGRFTAALVSVDPKNGAVRAMVAGPGHEQSKYNLVTQARRQPGSSFKPYVLLAALEEGYSPRDTVDGRTGCSFKLTKSRLEKPYAPSNYEGSKGSVGTIADATARSLNCAFVRIGLSLDSDPQKSLDKVAEMATRMGLKGQVDAVMATPLGSEEATPLEMASAYAALANDGIRFEPYLVERVLDRSGHVVLRGRSEGERVVSVQVARLATSVLRKVVEGGTGTRARVPGRQVAGKTGTSQEWRDAWFIGYTPQLATAVWMGSPVAQVSMRNVGRIRVTGGSYPARIWGAYMTRALAGVPVESFVGPDTRQLGKPKVVKGKYFTPSTDAPPRRRPARPTPARGPEPAPPVETPAE